MRIDVGQRLPARLVQTGWKIQNVCLNASSVEQSTQVKGTESDGKRKNRQAPSVKQTESWALWSTEVLRGSGASIKNE